MKSYLAILLSAFGLSFLISSYAPEINQDVLAAPVSNQEQSVELLSEKTEVEKTEVAELTDTANITTSYRATSVRANSGVPQSYTITQVLPDEYLVASPSYRDIYRTKKLVYAHNSNNLFGNLRYLGVGSTINLTENGVTTSYTVSAISHFTKVPYNGGENLVECNANYTSCGSDVQMGIIMRTAKGHKLALMTCDGGAGTPNRLILFVD